MHDSAADLPRTLAAAEELFREFLAHNGYPPDVHWLVKDSVVSAAQRECWIRDDRVKATENANLRYLAGLQRNLGIALRAVCASNTTTYATVFVPTDDVDAQYNLMGHGLKLSCPTERISAAVVKHPIKWFFLKLRYGRRSRALEL